jgi:hypothetical protein
LAKINSERAARFGELQELKFALTESRRHLADSQKAAAAAAERSRAELAWPILERLASAAKSWTAQ